ncbi:RNase adapter RapZ [Teichococcus vastitatis]|uniref:RNase adapter RapZ n=1 Tax=Teichococcus vastitatis TaxID=2307076 RepID=A0ABS9WBL5_9PROT|nr:RNase adapter RapZ [Pseudoroseomonas vastitatis]MCI0756613.1 RNase adapter RapZ [Pseudoroseomonas vastitatis]
MSPAAASRRPVVVVTGLSGAGKATVLRILEDLGFESIDNPPLAILEDVVRDGGTVPLAVGVDARTRGFDAAELLALLHRLRQAPGTAAELLFVTAEEAVLLRRFSETRRRHPLAPGGPLGGSVADGIARESALLAPLRDDADWVVDTSERPLPDLRRLVERHFRPAGDALPGLAVAVMSFAFPRGLPREADLVFDLRFLRNPHYDPVLRPQTGRDAAVAGFIRQDPDFDPFWQRMTALLDPLLPRYAAEGKKYLTVALGCTGGKHRSVLMAEMLSAHLAEQGWRVDLTHRELRALQAPSMGAMGAGGGEQNVAPPLSATGREAPSTCTT